MAEGFVDDRFAAVRVLFDNNIQSGADIGASFSATIDGETVVDLWGGFADAECTRSWTRDTIVNVYSTTKTMTALVALLLADRGELDFAAPVARYWPEFAAAGKSAVKVSHVMSHAAGLSGWCDPMEAADLYDWTKATSLLAAQAPFWEPGTACGYHAVTQGYLVGEIVRRITGKSLGTVFREEIATPLGADFHIGLSASDDARVADLIPPPTASHDAVVQTSPLQTNLMTNPRIDPLLTRTREWRAAEIPAAGGTGNARSVAEIHAIMANGGVAKGKRFLSEAGVRKAQELQIEGKDLILGIPQRYGMGFGLNQGLMPNANTIFWGGYGGSLVIIDMDKRATFAYAMNKMAPVNVGDMRGWEMIATMWRALS